MRSVSAAGNGTAGHVLQPDAGGGLFEDQTDRTTAGIAQGTIRLLIVTFFLLFSTTNTQFINVQQHYYEWLLGRREEMTVIDGC